MQTKIYGTIYSFYSINHFCSNFQGKFVQKAIITDKLG